MYVLDTKGIMVRTSFLHHLHSVQVTSNPLASFALHTIGINFKFLKKMGSNDQGLGMKERSKVETLASLGRSWIPM